MKCNFILLFFVIFFFLFGSSILLFVQGIEFYQGFWEDVLLKVVQEDKIIFVDVYVEWCGLCKWMVWEVFLQEEVGVFFNCYFINMKIDMEKGMGLEFCKKYLVLVFFILFFIGLDGEVV